VKKVVIKEPYTVVIEQGPKPQISDDQFLARAIATGISAGTERIRYNGTNPAYLTGRRSYPEEPGYEFVGKVTEIGKNITSVSPGDKIFALAPHCEYVAFREFDFFGVLPNEIDIENALFAALTMSTIHVAHRCNITLGDTVGVVGLGVFRIINCSNCKTKWGFKSNRIKSLCLER